MRVCQPLSRPYAIDLVWSNSSIGCVRDTGWRKPKGFFFLSLHGRAKWESIGGWNSFVNMIFSSSSLLRPHTRNFHSLWRHRIPLFMLRVIWIRHCLFSCLSSLLKMSSIFLFCQVYIGYWLYTNAESQIWVAHLRNDINSILILSNNFAQSSQRFTDRIPVFCGLCTV